MAEFKVGLLLHLAAIFFSLPSAICAMNENLYWTDNGNFLMYYGVPIQYLDALQFCGAAGGDLARIGNAAENNYLATFLADNQLSNAWFGMMTFRLNETNGTTLFSDSDALIWVNPDATGFASNYTVDLAGTGPLYFVRYYFNDSMCLILDVYNWIVYPPQTTAPSCSSLALAICKITADSNTTCPTNWKTRVGADNATKCYFVSGNYTWWKSVSLCSYYGQIANQQAYLLYMDVNDVTEISFLQTLVPNVQTVWLGALDANLIDESDNLPSDFWADGTPIATGTNVFTGNGSPLAWSNRNVFCPLLGNDTTWKTVPQMGGQSTNYSSLDCIEYEASAAYCRLSNFTVPPDIISDYDQIIKSNLTILFPSGTASAQTNLAAYPTSITSWNNIYIKFFGSIATVPTISNISNQVSAILGGYNNYVNMQCINTLVYSVNNGITQNGSVVGVNQGNVTLSNVTSSILIIDGYSPGTCNFPNNATTATLNSSNVFNDTNLISNFSNCLYSGVINNVSSNTASTTHSFCNYSNITIVSYVNAVMNLNNVTTAVQTVTTPYGISTLTNVQTNTAYLIGVLYLAAFVNVGPLPVSVCQSSSGFVLIGNHITNNTIIAESVSTAIISRISSVSTNNLYVTSVPLLNSSVASVQNDVQAAANVSTANVVVVDTANSALSFSMSANVYSTLWNVGNVTHNLINISNAVISANNVNTSSLLCPNNVVCTSAQVYNDVSLYATNVVQNSINCANLSSVYYSGVGGYNNSIVVTLTAGNATFSVNSVTNDYTNIASTNNTVITKSVTNVTSSTLVLASDQSSVTTVNAIAVQNHNFTQNAGQSATLTLTNVANSAATMCSSSMTANFNGVQYNTVNLCNTGQASIIENINGSTLNVISPLNMPSVTNKLTVVSNNVVSNNVNVSFNTVVLNISTSNSSILEVRNAQAAWLTCNGVNYLQTNAYASTLNATYQNVQNASINCQMGSSCNVQLQNVLNSTLTTLQPNLLGVLTYNNVSNALITCLQPSTTPSSVSVTVLASLQCPVVICSGATVTFNVVGYPCKCNVSGSSGNTNYYVTNPSESVVQNFSQFNTVVYKILNNQYSANLLVSNGSSLNVYSSGNSASSGTASFNVYQVTQTNLTLNNCSAAIVTLGQVSNSSLSINYAQAANVSLSNLASSTTQISNSLSNTATLQKLNYSSFSIVNCALTSLNLDTIGSSNVFLNNAGTTIVSFLDFERSNATISNTSPVTVSLQKISASSLNIANFATTNVSATAVTDSSIFLNNASSAMVNLTDWKNSNAVIGNVSTVNSSFMKLNYSSITVANANVADIIVETASSTSAMLINTGSVTISFSEVYNNTATITDCLNVISNFQSFNSSNFIIVNTTFSQVNANDISGSTLAVTQSAVTILNFTNWFNSTVNVMNSYDSYTVLSLSNSSNSNLNFADTLNVTSQITQVNNSLLAFNNVQLADVTLSKSNGVNFNFNNVPSVTIVVNSSSNAYANLTNVQFVTVKLVQLGISFNRSNIDNLYLPLNDALAQKTDNFRQLPNLTKTMPSTNTDRYSYYIVTSPNLTWARAVEQCAVLNSTLASISNDQEGPFYYNLAQQVGYSGNIWLGGMLFSTCKNGPTYQVTNIRWVYRTDNQLVPNVMMSTMPKVQTLCVAYNSTSLGIQEPPMTLAAPSCFQQLPFVCKMPSLSNGSCPVGWIVRNASYCYFLVQTPLTWTQALGWCASRSTVWPSSLATQSRLLDFDAWDLQEPVFVNQLIGNGLVWLSGLNANPVCETPYSFSWIDQSDFINYENMDFNSLAQSCPSYASQTGVPSQKLWKPRDSALQTDCVAEQRSFAVCKYFNLSANIYQIQTSPAPMTLQQAIVTCGVINGTIASLGSPSDVQNFTSYLNASQKAWLGVMTFRECENSSSGESDSSKIMWPDQDSRFSTDFASSADSTLCMVFNISNKLFQTPPVIVPGLKSCFQPLSFVCKQMIYDDSISCLPDWTSRNAESSGNGRACYYFTKQNMSWTSASAFCAAQSFGYQSPSLNLSSVVTAPRLLYFYANDESSEREFLTLTYPELQYTLIWTMALNNRPVCESNDAYVKDYWVDGTPFNYLGLNSNAWITRSTMCPLWNAINITSYDWSYAAVQTLGSKDCTSPISENVVCKVSGPPPLTTPLPTTTFPLKTPVFLIDIRYPNTADHYWCLTASCMNSQNLSYITNATVNSTGSIVAASSTYATVLVQDQNNPDSVSSHSLGKFGKRPTYLQLPIFNSSVFGVSLAPDPLVSGVMSFSSANQSCVQLAKYSQTNFSTNQRCILDPATCYYGFSAAVWVKFTQATLYAKSPTKMAIFGAAQSGFLMYQTGLITGVSIATGKDQWTYEVTDPQVTANKWINFGFRWKYDGGIYIYINNVEFATTTGQHSVLTLPVTLSSYLSIGCAQFSATQSSYFADMQLAHAVIWLWSLRDTERVYLSGGLNLALTMTSTSAPTTTVAANSYTYSYQDNMIPYQPVWSTYNPIYSLANFYSPLAIAACITASTASQVRLNQATSASQLQVVTFLTTKAYIQFSFANSLTSCMSPRQQTFCPNGLSAGVMLNLSTTAYQSTLQCSSNCASYLLMLYYRYYAMYIQNGFLVVEFYEGSRAAVIFPQGFLDKFISVGFTWSPTSTLGRSLVIYINGVAQTNRAAGLTPLGVATYLTASRPPVYNSGQFILGSSLGTLAPFQMRDLVIWERYLFSFEVGRFLGLTADQFAMFLSNTYWWTSDVYAYNTMQLLNAGSGIYQVYSAAYQYAPDRWNKSVAFALTGDAAPIPPWLLVTAGYPQISSQIGLFADSSCLINIGSARCQASGISAAIWLLVPQASTDKILVFFNSGSAALQMYSYADPNGFGLDAWTGFTFIQDGSYLGVSLSTAKAYWEMYLDATLFSPGVWINVGFTWSAANGMILYVNGQFTGLQQVQGISYTRSSIASNSHGRATIGRYSSDLTYFWSSSDSYTYAIAQISDLLYVEQAVNQETFASLIGLSGNPFYATAATYYTSTLLVTGTLPMLQAVKNANTSFNFGPYGDVSYSVGVNLNSPGAGIIIGYLNNNNCLISLATCAASGMSVSLWLFVPSNSPALNNSNTAPVYILRSSFYATQDGIIISALQGYLNVTVNVNQVAYTLPLALSLMPTNRFVNLGFVWQGTSNNPLFKAYLNGTYVAVNVTKSYYGAAVQWAANFLVIGALPSESLPTCFSVYNFVFWNYLLTTSQLNYLTGVTTVKQSYLGVSDIQWTFSGEFYSLQLFAPQLYGDAALVTDRYETGLAVQFTSAARGYVLLASTQQLLAQNACIVITTKCIGFYFQFWSVLTLESGYLVTSGAEDVYTNGFFVYQNYTTQVINQTSGSGVNSTVSSTLSEILLFNVSVRYATSVYQAVYDVTKYVGTWNSYSVFWNSSLPNIKLFVNGDLLIPASQALTVTQTFANKSSDLLLGKSLSAGTYVSSSFDDIYVKNIYPSSGFDLSNMIPVLTCYNNAFGTFTFNYASLVNLISGNGTVGVNHINVPSQALYLFGSDTLYSLGNVGCASKPSKCSSGLTLSAWVKVSSLAVSGTGNPVLSVIVASGTPRNSTGFAIYITSVSTSSLSIVNLQFELNDGNNYWLLVYTINASKILSVWNNYALSWSPNVGLIAYINGTAVMQQLQRVSPPPSGFANVSYSDLMLGKFTITDTITYLDAVFDTVTFWQMPFTTPGGTVPRTLTGDCSTPLASVPTAIPIAPYVTTLPANKGCQLAIDGVCTDGTVTNIKKLGNSSYPIAYDAAMLLLPNLVTLTNDYIVKPTVIPGVATTVTPTGSSVLPFTAAFLSSCARILLNVANNSNPVTSGQQAPSQLTQTQTFFVEVISNLLSPTTPSVWKEAGLNYTASLLYSLETFSLNTALALAQLNSSKSDVSVVPQVSSNVASYLSVVSSTYTQPLTFPAASGASAPWGASDSITIAGGAFATMNGSVAVASSVYNTISNLLPGAVSPTALAAMNNSYMVPNSRIISVATQPPITNWNNGSLVQVSLSLQTPNTRMKYGFVCAFWNFSATALLFNQSSNSSMSNVRSTFGAWDTSGCKVTSANSSSVTCACNHMTNFVVLMQPVPSTVPDLWAVVFLYLYIIGLTLSLIALSWFLFGLLKYKANLLKDNRCLIHINVILAFLVSDLLLLVALAMSGSACQLIAMLIQYFTIAAFEWLYFEQLHLHFAVTAGQLQGRFWKCYVPLGWLLPAVLTALGAALYPNAYGADLRCWLQYGSIPYYIFAMSCTLFIILALGTGAIVLCNVRTSKCRADLTKEFCRATKLTSICCLLLIIGWLLGSFALGPVTIPFQLFYVLTYTTNGIWIVMLFGYADEQLRPIFFCRHSKNKVDDSNAASLSASRADLLSIASSQIYSRSRPASAASFSIKSSKFSRRPESAFEDSRIMRVEYVAEPDLVQRLKKLKENTEQGGETGKAAIPDKLFEVENSSQASLQTGRKNFAKIAALQSAERKPFPTGDVLDEASLIQNPVEQVAEPVEEPKLIVKPKVRTGVKPVAPQKFSQALDKEPTTSAAAGFVKPKKKKVASKKSAKNADTGETPTPSASFVKPKKARKKAPTSSLAKSLEVNEEQENPTAPIFIKPKKHPKRNSIVADDAV